MSNHFVGYFLGKRRTEKQAKVKANENETFRLPRSEPESDVHRNLLKLKIHHFFLHVNVMDKKRQIPNLSYEIVFTLNYKF